MKYIFIVIITALSLACSTTDKDNSNPLSTDLIDNENPPVLEFETTEYDFGTIAQGEKVYHAFKFKNTGKSDLIISDVKPTCGCTVPKNWPKQPIKPGEGGEIEVQYDGSGNGLIRKLVTISANTNPAYTKLYLKGKVVGPE